MFQHVLMEKRDIAHKKCENTHEKRKTPSSYTELFWCFVVVELTYYFTWRRFDMPFSVAVKSL